MNDSTVGENMVCTLLPSRWRSLVEDTMQPSRPVECKTVKRGDDEIGDG